MPGHLRWVMERGTGRVLQPVGVLTLALLVLPGLLPRFPEVFGMRRPGVRMTIAFGVVLRLSLSVLLTALAFWRQIARFPPVFATLAPLVPVFLLSAVAAGYVVWRMPGGGRCAATVCYLLCRSRLARSGDRPRAA